MKKNFYNILAGILLVSQFINFDLSGFTREAEVITAVLRAPAVIFAKKAENDKKYKKAVLLSSAAAFIRLTNDMLALYDLCRKGDKSSYKWNKVMWVGQDFASFVVKVKRFYSSNSGNVEELSLVEEQRINLIISDFLKKLDLYVLPAVEGIAAVALSLNGVSNKFDQKLSLSAQAIVSGSRLLAEAIESKQKNVEQKLLIVEAVIHSVVLFVDIVKSLEKVPERLHEKPRENRILGEQIPPAPQEVRDGENQGEGDPAPLILPDVRQPNDKLQKPRDEEEPVLQEQPESIVDEHLGLADSEEVIHQKVQLQERRSRVGKRELDGLIKYFQDENLGRIKVTTPDGGVKFYDARLGMAPSNLIRSDE